jgi:hypothetical protein
VARSDEAIRDHVVRMLKHKLWLDSAQVWTAVDDGLATLTGTVSRRSTADERLADRSKTLRRVAVVPQTVKVPSRLGHRWRRIGPGPCGRYEDRTIRDAQEARRDASEEVTRQRTMSAVADDDHVYPSCVGAVDDNPGYLTRADPRHQNGGLDARTAKLLRGTVHRRHRLIVRIHEDSGPAHYDFTYDDDRQLRAVGLGQSRSESKAVVR